MKSMGDQSLVVYPRDGHWAPCRLMFPLKAWMMGWGTLCKFADDSELDGVVAVLDYRYRLVSDRHYQGGNVC